MRVGFLHPDLGLGGAERLVVDAASGLAKLVRCSLADLRCSLRVEIGVMPVPRPGSRGYHVHVALRRQPLL